MRLQCVRNFLVFGFIANDYIGRHEFQRLPDKQFGVVVGSEQFHFEPVLVLPYHVQSLTAYRAGRA